MVYLLASLVRHCYDPRELNEMNCGHNVNRITTWWTQAMLILSRKVGESLVIGEQVKVTVVRIAGDAVRIGIEAPDGQTILRKELWSKLSDAELHPKEEL